MALGFNLARLPFWMLYYLPAGLRQTNKYSLNKAVRIRVFKALLDLLSQIKIKTPEPLNPGKEGKQFVVIEPAPSSSYAGIVLKDPEIKPRAIGGTWYPALLQKFTGAEEVAIHFHGGAFVVGDGRKEATAFLAKTILAETPATHVFCPQYRLSSNPLGRFPAALQDAITALHHVTHVLGVPADRVSIGGDSAGGNITLALLRYIHDQPDASIPSPCAAFLWSAWVDPGNVLSGGGLRKAINAPKDYLPNSFPNWGALTYRPSKSSGVTLSDPYISFTEETTFQTPTPLFWSVGECEALYHDVLKFFEAMKAIDGNKSELYIEEGAPHDIILTAPTIGFEKEARETGKVAGRFLKGLKR